MRRFAAVVLVVFLAFAQQALGGEADEAMKKVRMAWEAADEESTVVAVTYNSAGRPGLAQQFHLWQAWKPSGQDQARIKFTAPAHYDGIQLLTEGERQWLKPPPPTKARSVRFEKGEGGTEFAQTVFTHEDLRSLDLQHYRYSGSGNRLVAVPIKETQSAYGRLELTLDRIKSVITEIRYFDKKGEHVNGL